MNEQDKKAMLEAKDRHVSNLEPSEIGYAPLDFSAGWQAALEYARGQQEPFTWAMEWWDKDGEYEVEYSTMGEFSFGRKNGFPLYRHPAQPVQPVNEQLLEALNATKAWLDAEDNHELEPDFFSRAHMANFAQHLVNDAIAAAEAAKEKQ